MKELRFFVAKMRISRFSHPPIPPPPNLTPPQSSPTNPTPNSLAKNEIPFPSKMFIFYWFYNVFGVIGLTGLSGLTELTGNGASRPRTDPGFPTPGSRMMVVYTNSLKLLHTIIYTVIYIYIVYSNIIQYTIIYSHASVFLHRFNPS